MDNVMDFPEINQIKDEAAAWMVKVHGHTCKTGHGLPEEEAVALKAWMAKSELHRDSFLRMLAGWDAMGMLEELADILPLEPLEQYAPAEQAAPSRLAWWDRWSARNLWLGFSGAATSVALGLWVMLTMLPLTQTYTTDIGEQASFTLADGSVITLNTNSEVQVDYGESRRSITLHRGEANFEVEKDRERPFVVYAGEGMVWAVGTAFNVNYRDDHIDVLVSEGKVKVFSDVDPGSGVAPDSQLSLPEPGGTAGDSGNAAAEASRLVRAVTLIAGEVAQYDQVIIDKQTLAQTGIEKRLAWQSGVLHFEGETLEQAIEEIARYTDKRLLIVDESLRHARVGGRFKTDDVDALLHSLSKSLNFKIEYGDKAHLLYAAQ